MYSAYMCDYDRSEIDSQLAVKLLHLSQLDGRRISVEVLEVFKRCVNQGVTLSADESPAVLEVLEEEGGRVVVEVDDWCECDCAV